MQERLDGLLVAPQEKFREIHKVFQRAYRESAQKHRIYRTCDDQPYDLEPDGEFTSFFTEKNWLGEHSFVIGTWTFEFHDGEVCFNESRFPQEYFVLPIDAVKEIAQKEAEEWADKQLRAEGRKVDPII